MAKKKKITKDKTKKKTNKCRENIYMSQKPNSPTL